MKDPWNYFHHYVKVTSGRVVKEIKARELKKANHFFTVTRKTGIQLHERAALRIEECISIEGQIVD